ncbi:MAG: hypothetical protein ABS36_15745 [Acidobacteria bacterium SCN 69-37]|nr:MAG: hypothetical protein ABS36_15745 [Acidobacteria bacterium SCN 69-37]
MTDDACLYEATHITKAYPGTTALRDVTFRLRAGEVHALIGENGAGKSTLVKILAGVDVPTSGTLRLDGRDVAFRSVGEAAARGIGLIHQELQLFPDLSIAENLFVGRERVNRWGTIDTAGQMDEARRVLRRLGQDLDPRAMLGALPLGLQQIVEIGRALVAETRVLMMDEPTSALTTAEIRVLFAIIRDLAARGVAIVYISHHLHELIEIADRVTVLRDGVHVGEAATSTIDVPWIVERMTGRRADRRNRQQVAPGGDVVLDVRDLSVPAAPGRTGLDRVSLQVRAGEVVGIYGLLGAGRTELFEGLMGVCPVTGGEVRLSGRRLDGLDVSDRVACGLAMVPEDRQAAGLVQPLDILQNMALSSLPRLASWGLVRSSMEAAEGTALAQRLRVKAAGLETPVTALSGGNQQKVVIARSVMARPRVLLFDDPTRGVDVAAKAEILETMRSLAADGLGVAFASSDLAEILDGADRVLVMARGHISGEVPIADATEASLTALASASALVAESDGAVHVH